MKVIIETNTKTLLDKNEAFVVNSKIFEDERGGLSKFVIIMSKKALNYLEFSAKK